MIKVAVSRKPARRQAKPLKAQRKMLSKSLGVLCVF